MISSLFKSKKLKEHSKKLKTDIHSHLIPGIDDGVQSIEESIAILKYMLTMGYEKVITTPHVMQDSYNNTKATIETGLSRLKEAAQRENIPVHIEAAAEYYIDEGFIGLIESGDLMCIGNSRYILIETSYMAKPMIFEETIFRLVSQGYTPILAHPERYRYIMEPEKEYVRFKNMGILFQVNINSFNGHYGNEAKKKAYLLHKKKMIDFLGSDIHHLKHAMLVEKFIQSNNFHDIMQDNVILNDILLEY